MSDDFSFGRVIPNPDAGHLAGCEVQMVANHGEEFMGLSRCVDGCPHLHEARRLGRELAAKYGW